MLFNCYSKPYRFFNPAKMANPNLIVDLKGTYGISFSRFISSLNAEAIGHC